MSGFLRPVLSGIGLALLFSSPALAQFAPFSHTVPDVAVPEGVCVANCGGSDNYTPPRVDPALAIAAAEARAKDIVDAANFYAKGLDLYKAGNLKAAVYEWQKAVRKNRSNTLYTKQLAALQHQILRSKSGFTELRIAAIEQSDAAAGTGAPALSAYDTRTGTRPSVLPGTVRDLPEFAVLAEKLKLPVDLRDPKNTRIVATLNQVAYMKKYNERAEATGAYKADTVAFQKAVTELNVELQKQGVPVPAVTAEQVLEPIGFQEAPANPPGGRGNPPPAGTGTGQ